jgi:hypothetical protein
MRRIAASILALALLAPSFAGAAATPKEKFQKAVAKQAVSMADVLAGKWKGLCACRASSTSGALTYEDYGDRIVVFCGMATFDPAGTLTVTSYCLDYTPLVK